MDQRPGPDGEPVRIPRIYYYENGIPVDWTSRQALKALNDRRRDAIARFTCDPPWTDLEREYLTQLCVDYPDASILEYAERFNWRFHGDYKEKTGIIGFHQVHPGRTLESVRYEYLSFKKLYDRGEVPQPTREESEKINGMTQDQWLDRHGFGTKEGTKNTKDDGPKGPVAKKAQGTAKQAKSDDAPTEPFVGVDPEIELSDDFLEELFELAGGYHPDEVRKSLSPCPASTDKQFRSAKTPTQMSFLTWTLMTHPV